MQSIKDAVRLSIFFLSQKGILKLIGFEEKTARYETAVLHKYDRVTKERVI
jgi:hypothetical protein